MDWCKSPPFLCTSTKTARDVAEELVTEPASSLPPYPLEHHTMAPSKWPHNNLHNTCFKYLHTMELYVDDFYTMAQTSDASRLCHLSHSLFYEIHSVFPLSDISGYSGGDPISERKNMEGEGEWDIRKEILGCVFDGARRCIKLPTAKLNAITEELQKYFVSQTSLSSDSKKLLERCVMRLLDYRWVVDYVHPSTAH